MYIVFWYWKANIQKEYSHIQLISNDVIKCFFWKIKIANLCNFLWRYEKYALFNHGIIHGALVYFPSEHATLETESVKLFFMVTGLSQKDIMANIPLGTKVSSLFDVPEKRELQPHGSSITSFAWEPHEDGHRKTKKVLLSVYENKNCCLQRDTCSFYIACPNKSCRKIINSS